MRQRWDSDPGLPALGPSLELWHLPAVFHPKVWIPKSFICSQLTRAFAITYLPELPEATSEAE